MYEPGHLRHKKQPSIAFRCWDPQYYIPQRSEIQVPMKYGHKARKYLNVRPHSTRIHSVLRSCSTKSAKTPSRVPVVGAFLM